MNVCNIMFRQKFFIHAALLLLFQVTLYASALYLLIETKIGSAAAKPLVGFGIGALTILYFQHFKNALSAAALSVLYFFPFVLIYFLLCAAALYAHALPSYSELSLSENYFSALKAGKSSKVMVLQATTLWSMLLCSVITSTAFILWIKRQLRLSIG